MIYNKNPRNIQNCHARTDDKAEQYHAENTNILHHIILFSFYISLTKWKGFGPMEFIGFRNYSSLLRDTAFYHSLFNSLILVLEAMIPIQILGLIVALLLNYGFIKWGNTYVRNAMFLPYVTAPIAIGIIFSKLRSRSNIIIW